MGISKRGLRNWGWGREVEQQEGKLRDFSKHFFPRRVKLTLEGIYGGAVTIAVESPFLSCSFRKI